MSKREKLRSPEVEQVGDVASKLCDGQDLKEMFLAGTALLDRNGDAINALNVFPVPDGDTGTNMLLTMRATMAEAERSSDRSAAAVSRAMAYGALMGARGNSGVILSQILRGLALGLDKKDSFSGPDLASALGQASLLAYKGVSQPVEGTILTVIREAAAAAQTTVAAGQSDVISVLESAVGAAREAVAKTPTLLAVLREAGVVDAGGQGLYVILEGALRRLCGGEEELDYQRIESLQRPLTTASPIRLSQERTYGYCTEFLLQGDNLNLAEIKGKLSVMGSSALVVGDEQMIRAHVHTFDPGAAISYATSLGTLRQVKVDNMDDQHQHFIVAKMAEPKMSQVSIVAVASGLGLAEVFQSLGASNVVPGGHGTNPSTGELVEAVNSAPTDSVIILPNNKNIIPAAEQTRTLTYKRVMVIPSITIPQGVAALLAFNYEVGLEENLAAMEGALKNLQTAEIAVAVRSTFLNGVRAKKGQAVGLINGELVIACDNILDALLGSLTRMITGKEGLVTVYFGEDTPRAEAERGVEAIRQRWPQLEVELIDGGQPYYQYIVSVE